jgi:3-oxoadipate CoA-transferase alpha subunit
MRAGAAGIPAFYTPTAVGTPLAEGKELRAFDGREYVMERALKGDFALVRCDTADHMGNLTFNKTARNFGPVMCMAAQTTIVQARRVVEPGGINPEHVVTPGIFVDRVVEIADPLQESQLIEEQRRYP